MTEKISLNQRNVQNISRLNNDRTPALVYIINKLHFIFNNFGTIDLWVYIHARLNLIIIHKNSNKKFEYNLNLSKGNRFYGFSFQFDVFILFFCTLVAVYRVRVLEGISVYSYVSKIISITKSGSWKIEFLCLLFSYYLFRFPWW